MQKIQIALFAILAIVGCRTQKAAVAETANQPKQVDFLQKKLRENAPAAVRQLNARARLNIESDGSTMQATANLMWLKDSVLWVQVKKFGIEGARALVTRDSIFILNRLEKTLTVKTWADLRRDYNLPEGFPLLENVVLGTAWFAENMVLNSDLKDGQHRIAGKSPRFAADYRVEEGTFRVRQMTFLEQTGGRAVTLGFDNFQKIGSGGALPYLRHIETFDSESGATKVEIELSDVEINAAKSFRFEIPSHYRRVR